MEEMAVGCGKETGLQWQKMESRRPEVRSREDRKVMWLLQKETPGTGLVTYELASKVHMVCQVPGKHSPAMWPDWGKAQLKVAAGAGAVVVVVAAAAAALVVM